VLQVLARLSWFQTSQIAPGNLDELGVSTSIQAQLGPHVAFRLSTMARTVLNGQTSLFSAATGQIFVADAELAGTF